MTDNKTNFKKGEYVVYPTHGVGVVEDLVTETFAGNNLDLVVVKFEKERLTLRVPVEKIQISGLRKVADKKTIDEVLKKIKGKPSVKKAIWSRRAQEYENKINSGDIMQIAEVVRDLHMRTDKIDQSYSEKQIYEQALERLSREFAAVNSMDPDSAIEKIEKHIGVDKVRELKAKMEEEKLSKEDIEDIDIEDIEEFLKEEVKKDTED